MGIGRRIYRLVRANLNHLLRGGSEEAPSPHASEARWQGPQAEAEGATGTGAAGRHGTGPSRPPGPGDARLREHERHYRALELPYGAGPDAIKRAHRRLLGRFHPDRFARDPARLEDATRLTRELTQARDALLRAIERGDIRPRPGDDPAP